MITNIVNQLNHGVASMPRLFTFSYLPLLLLLLLCSCAPKNSSVIKVDNFEIHNVYGKTDLESLILVGDYLYEKKDYLSLKKAAEGYLEKNSHNSMGCLYVNNLLAELMTYQVVDFEKSFTLNEDLVETTRNFDNQESCLLFNRDAHDFVQPTLGGRVLFSSIMLMAWVDPSIWGEAKEVIISKTESLKIQDTEFVKKYFTIPVKVISQLSQQRLDYLDELIGG